VTESISGKGRQWTAAIKTRSSAKSDADSRGLQDDELSR
jgi:hypothetical protein